MAILMDFAGWLVAQLYKLFVLLVIFAVLFLVLPTAWDLTASVWGPRVWNTVQGAKQGLDQFDITLPAAPTPIPFPATHPAPAAAQPASATGCMRGEQLAAQMGWPLTGTQDPSITMYGGARVQLPTNAHLPSGWEIIGAPGKVSSIYPPQECRQVLGVAS